MNVLEQLHAMGFREQPYQFYDGGDTNGDPSGGAGPGPGGPSNAEITAADAIASLGLTQSSGATLNDAIANALAEVVTSNISKDWSSSEGRSARSALQSLESMGRGRMEGLNPNNPTQSVQNLLASSNVAAAAPYAMSFMPGMGLAKGIQTGAQLVADLSSGKLSPQDALADLGLSLASAITGQSKGALAAAAKGEFGEAAALAAKGAIVGTLAQATGLPAGVVGAGFNAATSGINLGGTSLASSGAPAPSETQTGDSAAGVSPSVMEALAELAPASERDISSIMPLLSAASISNMVKQQKESEQKEQEALSERLAIKSPFGEMPYDNSFMRG